MVQKLKDAKSGFEELKSGRRRSWAGRTGSALLWRAVTGRLGRLACAGLARG